jgi:hypothetical protein
MKKKPASGTSVSDSIVQAAENYIAARERFDEARSRTRDLHTFIQTTLERLNHLDLRQRLEKNPLYPFTEGRAMNPHELDRWPTAQEISKAYRELFDSFAELEVCHKTLPEGLREDVRLPDLT